MATEKKVTKTENKKTPVKSALALEVFDMSGKVVGNIELPKAVFGATPNQKLISQAVRYYLSTQRLGNADTKTRGEIRGGGRKPWRQKGTGRARIGSIRAPHWRGGGVTFGPTPRDFSLILPKKMRQQALISALSSKLKDQDLVIVKEIDFKEAKTKMAAEMFKNLKLDKRVLVVDKEIADKEKKALRNLASIETCLVANLNTYTLVSSRKVVLTKTAVDSLGQTLGGQG